jgi:agmatine/peptidylarginine deiminase
MSNDFMELGSSAPSELTVPERIYLLLQRNTAARWTGIALLSLPAVTMVCWFWWNVGVKVPARQAAAAAAPAAIHPTTAYFESDRPLPVRTTSKLAPGMQLPGEFERQDGIILGCSELVEFHPEVLVDMVRAMAGRLEIYGLVNDASQRQKVVSLLDGRGINSSLVRLIELPTYGMWVRDYGPKFIRNNVGGLTMLDYAYLDRPATDGSTRAQDDVIPSQLSKHFRTPVASVPLSMEGGNLLGNGYGLCVSTLHLVRENSHRHYEPQDVGKILVESFGQLKWTQIEFLHHDTTRHADTYVNFAAPNIAIVASCDPMDDMEEAAIMDRTAKLLEGQETPLGPMRVVRIPMRVRNDNVIRTYANAVYANGVVLVPQYDDVDPEFNRQAVDIYASVLPDWKIVPIQCLSIAKMGGALHCVTCNVPSPSLLPANQTMAK